MGESFFAFGDFAGVTTRESVLIATVDDIADDEIGGDNGNISEDVSGDGPDAGFERVLVGNVDPAVPRGETKEITTTASESRRTGGTTAGG